MISEFQKALQYFASNPNDFVLSTINEFLTTKQQKSVLNVLPQAMKEDRSIAVKSGHGVGKTAIAAAIVLWFITVFPNPKIVCTAPSKAQLMDVLWPEIAKWQQKYKFGDLFEWTKTRFYLKSDPENWFASARTSNKPEAMAGIHGEHVLILMDEASGIDQKVYETMEGAETEKGALRILLSNPTTISGEFFDAFHSKKDYYYTFTFSSADSERVKPEYAKKIAAKYGEDSNVYRVRVLGEFPRQEDDSIFSIDLVEDSHNRFNDVEDINVLMKRTEENDTVSFGVDVARFGDDESSIYANVGNVIKKEKILRKIDTMTLVGNVINLRKTKYKDFEAAVYNVDLTGVGNGVVDRINELISQDEALQNDRVVGVENNRKAMNEDEYGNIISELWFNLRDFLRKGGMLEPDDIEEINNIQSQLVSRKFAFDSRGRFTIESKKELKKRLNGISPDRADGAVLCIADRVIRGNMLFTEEIEEDSSNETTKEVVQKFNTMDFKDRLKFFKK